MTGKFTFILGGARSGKSGYAVESAKHLEKKTAFIATCVYSDAEMKQRIKKHKASRPSDWKVEEEVKEIGRVIGRLEKQYEVILVDCLGLWISNLLAEKNGDGKIEKEIKQLAKTVRKTKSKIFIVSNETGAGIVPDNLLARRFRDLLGFLNQLMAKEADKVVFMQAGIPVIIKGSKI